MTRLENELLATLNELEQAARTFAAANPKPSLRPLLTRIDELTGQLPSGSDPNLLHYLHKKSYEKARLLLQNRDGENVRGKCR